MPMEFVDESFIFTFFLCIKEMWITRFDKILSFQIIRGTDSVQIKFVHKNP